MLTIPVSLDEKTVASVVRRSIDWSAHMESGDTIATVDFASPAAMPVVGEAIAGLLTPYVVSAGLAGWTHRITATITTNGGETLQAHIDTRIYP